MTDLRSPTELALDMLSEHLRPFMKRVLSLQVPSSDGTKTNLQIINEKRAKRRKNSLPEDVCLWPPDEFISAMLDNARMFYNEVDPNTTRDPSRLNATIRSLVQIIDDLRNRWAHRDNYSDTQALTFITLCEQLLSACNADHAAKLLAEKRKQFNYLQVSPAHLISELANSSRTTLPEYYQRFKRDRLTIMKISRKYYVNSKLNILSLPLVAKREWIPSEPISLEAIDQTLRWTPDEKLPPPQPFPLLGWEDYDQFSQRVDPGAMNDDRFCYRLLDVQVAGAIPCFVFSPGRYQAFVKTCEAKAFELAASQYSRSHASESEEPTVLPLRGAPEDIFNFRNRCAVAGFSTAFLVLNGPGGDCFYVHQRADCVLEWPGFWHVIPAGTFSPASHEDVLHDRDFSLQRVVLREFGEEMLGIEEVQGPIWDGKDFYDDEKLSPFVLGMEEGSVRLYYLGVGISADNQKPEIFTSLVIDGARFPEEWLSHFTPNVEGRFMRVPLADLDRWCTHDKMMYQGAMCLRLVQRHLEFFKAAVLSAPQPLTSVEDGPLRGFVSAPIDSGSAPTF